MSVIITGMDMPKSCEYCSFCEYTGGIHRCVRTMEAVGEEVHITHTRHKNCPLRSVEGIKAGFRNRYPKNYMGEPELGGRSCAFSLNKVLDIIDRHVRREVKDAEDSD